MKKHILRYFIPVAAVVSLYACKKNDGVTNQAYDAYDITASQGQLKVNVAVAYTLNPANMLIKINGKTVSNLLAGRTPFPGGGYNTNGLNWALYLSVPQGANTVALVIPKTGTDVDSVVRYTGTVTIPDNAAYTLHITDTLVSASSNNTKTVLVKNLTNRIDTGRCQFKFVNLIPNIPAVDLYINGVLLKSNVAYLAATDTFTVRTGVNAPGYSLTTTVPTLTVRPAGAAATSAAVATYSNANVLQPQLALTIFAMGYTTGTGTRAPFVSLTLDKNQ